ncbi:MAG: BglII/BstYI family type II restriction endonuclease [Porticoccaceae bacterium]
MYETETYLNDDILPASIRDRWELMETGSACAVLKAVCPNEWEEIKTVLDSFQLKAPEWLRAGGNRGDIAKIIDSMFEGQGWKETRIDIRTQGILINKDGSERERLETVYQEGYLVDNFKGRVVVDVEWNAKDGNLDRDLSAYRSWHEAGVIVAAVMITQNRETLKALATRLWDDYQSTLPEAERTRKLPIDLSTSTTTNLTKAALRVRRGVMGTCPVLIVAASESTWDGQPYKAF